MTEATKPAWPADVEIITLSKIEMLGVHKKTDQLYWNGQPVITKHELGRREFFLAAIAAWATVAAAVFAGADLVVRILGG